MALHEWAVETSVERKSRRDDISLVSFVLGSYLSGETTSHWLIGRPISRISLWREGHGARAKQGTLHHGELSVLARGSFHKIIPTPQMDVLSVATLLVRYRLAFVREPLAPFKILARHRAFESNPSCLLIAAHPLLLLGAFTPYFLIQYHSKEEDSIA